MRQKKKSSKRAAPAEDKTLKQQEGKLESAAAAGTGTDSLDQSMWSYYTEATDAGTVDTNGTRLDPNASTADINVLADLDTSINVPASSAKDELEASASPKKTQAPAAQEEKKGSEAKPAEETKAVPTQAATSAESDKKVEVSASAKDGKIDASPAATMTKVQSETQPATSADPLANVEVGQLKEPELKAAETAETAQPAAVEKKVEEASAPVTVEAKVDPKAEAVPVPPSDKDLPSAQEPKAAAAAVTSELTKPADVTPEDEPKPDDDDDDSKRVDDKPAAADEPPAKKEEEVNVVVAVETSPTDAPDSKEKVVEKEAETDAAADGDVKKAESLVTFAPEPQVEKTDDDEEQAGLDDSTKLKIAAGAGVAVAVLGLLAYYMRKS